MFSFRWYAAGGDICMIHFGVFDDMTGTMLEMGKIKLDSIKGKDNRRKLLFERKLLEIKLLIPLKNVSDCFVKKMSSHAS